MGWYLYFGGLVVYLASYLVQIVFPTSVWSQSAIGFTAGARSTLFWLAGIGLVCPRSWLSIPWRRAIYLVCGAIFLTLHTGPCMVGLYQFRTLNLVWAENNKIIQI